MLLAEILKATHVTHVHHARLSLALSMVTETAHIVNEAVIAHTAASLAGPLMPRTVGEAGGAVVAEQRTVAL